MNIKVKESLSVIGGCGLLLAILLACAGSQSSRVIGPDGKVWISITCRRSQNNCWEEASEQCPRGYDIGDANGQDGTVYVSNYNRYGGTTIPVHTYRGSLMIHCK